MNKQIEEMAKMMRSNICASLPCPCYNKCDQRRGAEILWEAGYRKQSDVKADTVRKMAERLKLYYNNLSGTTSPVLTAYHIDQVAKEMLDGYAEPFGIMDGIKKKMMEDERDG